MSLCFAHRGFSGHYPENTLLAFEKAIEAGADGIELDVHLSRDSVPVVIHDETLDRTTDHSGPVFRHTAAELSRMDASGSYFGRFGKNPIPTLSEYLELIRNRDVVSNIELKTDRIWYEGIEETVLALLKQYRVEDRVILSSFNHHSALKAKALAPHVPVAFLEGSRLVRPGDYLRAHGVTLYHPDYTGVDEALVEELGNAGIGVNAWTVNDEAAMARMLHLGVGGIITNHPDRLLQIRGRKTAG